MMNNRWHTALHEAGHAAATIALGGTVPRASIGPDGTGACYCVVSNETDEAFLTAAGDIAAEILADAPSPADEGDTHEPPTPRILPPILDEGCRPLIAAKDVARGAEGVSDAVYLAQWAIKGREADPDCWAGRVAFARHVARQIVTDHQAEILRIAAALFFRQAIFEEEIMAAFKGNDQ